MNATGLGAAYVHQIDPQTFRTTIQNPTCPDALLLAVQALAPPGSGTIQESDITILEVETSIDAKPKAQGDSNQLVNAAMHLAHHHANPPGKFRIVRKSGHFLGNTAPVSQIQFGRALQDGDNTINAGQHADVVKGETGGDPFRLRIYVKRYDSKPGASYASLLPTQHTARIEAILSGDLCPFTTIAEWRAFKFESLTQYFRQVRATPASQLSSQVLDWMASIGQPIDTDKQVNHRRNSKAGTARDTDLNRRIYRTLARLSQRQNDSKIAEIRTPAASQKQAPPLENCSIAGASPEYLIQQPSTTTSKTIAQAPHQTQECTKGATRNRPLMPPCGIDKANSASYQQDSTSIHSKSEKRYKQFALFQSNRRAQPLTLYPLCEKPDERSPWTTGTMTF